MHITILGATGFRGEELINALADSNLSFDKIRLMDEEEAVGRMISFRDTVMVVTPIDCDILSDQDILIIVEKLKNYRIVVEQGIKNGARIIDCTGELSENENVPLILDGINEGELDHQMRIIAIPSMVTSCLALSLKTIASTNEIKQVVCSYVHGYAESGRAHMDELLEQTRTLLNFGELDPEIHELQLAFTCYPAREDTVDVPVKTSERLVQAELRRLFKKQQMCVSLFEVWVPIFVGFSMACHVECTQFCDIKAFADALRADSKLTFIENCNPASIFSTQAAVLEDDLRIGGLREDNNSSACCKYFLIGDNLRHGFTSNVISIISFFSLIMNT